MQAPEQARIDISFSLELSVNAHFLNKFKTPNLIVINARLYVVVTHFFTKY